MPPKRGQSSNTLNPQDSSSLGFPRSTSPSSGFTQLLSKPSKWFTRSASAPKISAGSTEPRASSSSSRKHKISRPTDPRPILEIYGANPGSRSVLDLSSTRPAPSLDLPNIRAPSSPSSPVSMTSNGGGGGLGDLRNISQRSWSRSADDLGKFSNPPPQTMPPPSPSFQEKIAQYRSRNNSNASDGKHPFPTSHPSPSSSPPHMTHFPPSPTISVSGPEFGQPLVHVRSHSFTPKQSSRLAASPAKRKGSGDSGELNVPRNAFPFHLPTSASPSSAGNRPTTLLAPPTIVEHGPAPEGDSTTKRASQIVYHSGFINRLIEPPSHHQYVLSKGWKPFKMELKGSKLYFFKPPSDRAAAIKELFPTEFIPDIEDVAAALPVVEEGNGSTRKKEDRRKRAYWGRKTHPSLTHTEDGVQSGTFEALVHEAVFATTFNLKDEGRSGWMDFASALLLCLPNLVGRGKFEVEFLRCCDYLVSGATPEDEKEGKSRVQWLAGEYLRYYTQPEDSTAWENWKKEILPDVSLLGAAEMTTSSSGLPTSMSMQALYNPSPNPNVNTPNINSVGSPNLHTFSPRPEDSTNRLMPSLMDAFNHPSPPSSPLPWAGALDKEGLSRDVLHLLSPQLIADSLTHFHRTLISQAPETLAATCLFGSTNDRYISAFLGTDDDPHWLTKLLLVQILGADTSSGYAPHHQMDENRPTSKTHSRSEVIGVWVKVGEHCRAKGDESSWRAIFAAVCAPPVARLEKVWKRVEPGVVGLVEGWIREGKCPEARVTPWGGDVAGLLQEEMAKVGAVEEGGELKAAPMEKARRYFESFRTLYELCPRKGVEDVETGDGLKKLVDYWGDMFREGGGGGGLATRFHRVEQFMSLSFAAEPRRKGLFEPYYWTRQASSNQSSLLPLLFPEPLPSLSLVDRNKFMRGRVDSDAPPTIQELQAIDGHLRPDDRQNLTHADMQNLASLTNGGTVIVVHNGDLRLVVQRGLVESAPNSRPPSRVRSRPPSSDLDGANAVGGEKAMSRTPSIRVKAGASKVLDRKSSMARRNSLPVLSNKRNYVTSEPSSEPPLRVLVQSGTLDQLVKVLVHGLQQFSVSVADDNGEMALKEGMTRELALDHREFTNVWWNVFRSFVTPLVLFELLRKLYITSVPLGHNPFITEYTDIIQTRCEVLETLKEWIAVGGGAQDMLDDSSLLLAVRSFLDSPTDHIITEGPNFQDPGVHKLWRVLLATLSSLRSMFRAYTMRPSYQNNAVSPSLAIIPETRVRNMSTRSPPDVDAADPDQIVDNLDGMACAAFSNVTEEDLFVTADLLEVQSADRTGWFLPRDVSSLEESVEIQTIYSLIQDIEPSPMISELGQDSLYRILPPGIRSCIRAFSIIRKWLISKIVASRIGLRQRMARMELFLKALEIARLRHTDVAAPGRIVDQQCVRSFVEAVLTSAILSVESRTHQRAWQSVAASRGTGLDSLASLLFRPNMDVPSSKEALTVDMGWLIERLLDIISTPDVVSSGPEMQSLVNFDKRRHLYSLISKAPSLSASRRHGQTDINRRGFERLNNIEREVFTMQFDLRGIKEEAQRESLSAPSSGTGSARKATRPFHKLVALQVEKNRRDRSLRGRLQKEKMLEQSRNERRDDLLNKAMRPRIAVPKQHRSKKSMSAFLQFMRPISSAFTSDSFHSPGMKRSASELDFTTSGKPATVLSLTDARVAQLINTERSYTFQLDTEDGGHYVLQATSKKDMAKWLETIERVTNMAAKRRLTYLANSPQPQPSDHIHTQPVTSTCDPVAVFGVELDFLLQREAGGRDVPPGTIPSVVEECLSEVEKRGLTEVGIYRIAGAVSEITTLKDAFNRGEHPLSQTNDIHAVCDLVKTWFRVLPEPVFPPSSYHDVIEAMKLENLDDRLHKIRSVVQNLSQGNFDLLKRVSLHLDRVTDFEEQNQMTAEALAIVFSPNLLRAPQNDFAVILANMGSTHKLVKALMTHFHVIFDENDPADADPDDELDSPILEEDEDESDDQFAPTNEPKSAPPSPS